MTAKLGLMVSRGVPMRRGDFMAAQRVKCERDSARDRSGLPTSTMSASEWPQKFVLASWNEFVFMMRVIISQQTVGGML